MMWEYYIRRHNSTFFFIKNWKNLPFSDLKVSGFGSISNPDQSLFTSTA